MSARVLEVAIGLAFVFLLLSALVSSLNELLSWIFSLRAKSLSTGLSAMLQDETLKNVVYEHSLIKSLGHDDQKPSYIPSDLFTAALVHHLLDQGGGTAPGAKGADGQPAPAQDQLAVLRAGISNLPDAPAKALQALVDKGVADIDEARERIGKWFDSSMERASGAYKRRVHKIVLAAAAALSIGFNADSLRMAEAFWTDPAVRQAVVAQAVAQLVPAKADTAAAAVQHAAGKQGAVIDPKAVIAISSQIQTVTSQIEGLGLPIGWAGWTLPQTRWAWMRWVLGLLATIMAVSLGAPFWFDLLNRLVNLRSSGPKPKAG